MLRARALIPRLSGLNSLAVTAGRNAPARRPFHNLYPNLYDGVYKELEAMHLKKPWLRALVDSKYGAHASHAAAQQPDLAPKRMQDSYHKLTLPLAHDEWLVDTYVNAQGKLRLGSLFQDLDALAGVVAYKHTGPGPTLVTAAVDRISIINPLSEFCDLQLSGFVSYVGKSSMEISLEARRIDRTSGSPVPGPEGLLLTCAFTFVARNPATNKAMSVAPLLLETKEEKTIFARGEAYKNAKKALAKADLSVQAPNEEEGRLIHELWKTQQSYDDPMSPAQKPANTEYMAATTISSTSIMQPQYRNRHSFMIFGGFLLKSTMELAFCACNAFAQTRPTFVSLDPSTFKAPVPVGSTLYLTATVAHTEERGRGTRVQVRVESRVRDVETGKVDDTGIFNYTFWVEGKRKVMPVTYGEFMKYVDARRRAKQQELVAGTDDGTAARITE